jgi:ATP-dependent helicase/nuclease subunit A
MMRAGAGNSSVAAARESTARLQRAAADPAVSAWVSANAGTGKTHVLTMRVLRLLLAGTSPDRILCLTYTKAAAAEMSSRVFERLAGWVTADDQALSGQLVELLGRAADAVETERARQLFAVAIETPGGLKVQTIHAFCERLLQRFPLEAGVPPQFATLDDASCRSMQRQAIDEVLTAATQDKRSRLGQSLQCAVTYAVDDRFDDMLRDALAKRDWLEAAGRLDLGEPNVFAAAEALYRRAFGLAPGATVAELEQQIAALLSSSEIERARDVLRTGSNGDIKLAACMEAAMGTATPRQLCDCLATFFMTAGGTPRDRLMTKALAAEHATLHAKLQDAQAQFVQLQRDRGHLIVVQSTIALLELADEVMRRYGEHKARRAALDFDDLIRKTALLLDQHASAEWVLYKLDGGLDHILVDEAQDTSPVQWSVIEALAREFFAGAGARTELVRTLFAVGDEKQSIYGFQGARPDMFARVGRSFAAAAVDAGLRWSNVPLTLSFRSVAPVLGAVDKVFADASRTPGMADGGDAIRHMANRLGQAGLVEIWDTEKSGESGVAEAWAPLDEAPVSSPVARLAARIAETVEGWLDRGERLASEDRPINPGDILILVRKRRPFADTIVNALKERGIPVAGADRISLLDQIAVQDLMAVGDFILLPEDDLNLAALLKSPLFGLDDDDLLALAPGRKGSLWTSLLAAAESGQRFERAAVTLKRWRAEADYTPPYEFFVAVLNHDGGRTRLLERLGPEAADAIDEFISLALRYDEQSPPSLQGFLDWLRHTELVVKRDMEQGRGEVRVMTVHGAKGLEAPIVFLPDTCSTQSGERPGGLLQLPDAERPPHVPEPFCWPVKGSSQLPVVQNARQRASLREAEERNRLLYVALTRARDRLYIGGFEGPRGRTNGCWYNLVTQALAGELTETQDARGRRVLRLECGQQAAHEMPKRKAEDADAAIAPPPWAERNAPREPVVMLPLTPSRLAPLETDGDGEPVEKPDDGSLRREPPAISPSDPAGQHRFLRGTLTHALLQHLPTLERSGWERAAHRFVEARGAVLSARTRASIVAETMAVLTSPQFASLFGPDSIAEVPIVAEIAAPGGKGPTLRLTGQIDRLARTSEGVLIVDYKTNRPPPKRAEDAPDAYVLQLAAYRLALRQIYGGAMVRAALLWTEGPHITEIPANTLDNAEKRLFTVDRPALDG